MLGQSRYLATYLFLQQLKQKICKRVQRTVPTQSILEVTLKSLKQKQNGKKFLRLKSSRYCVKKKLSVPSVAHSTSFLLPEPIAVLAVGYRYFPLRLNSIVVLAGLAFMHP